MKQSEIKFTVSLDEEKVPIKLEWQASDSGMEGTKVCNATLLTIWDPNENTTLRIDLWTKDMPVDEMKRFYIECVGGIAQSVLSATGDEQMANEINALCDRLVELVKQEKK